MTITYTQDVATCTGLGVFWKILFRWKGSIYKLVWSNLLVYCILYFSLSALYRFGLNENQQELFEYLALYCHRLSDLIPVTFVLGFYVSIVITRWWDQYRTIPWPDSCCLFISTCLHGLDERGRLMRRTIARYLIVALVQTLRMTSVKVKKRFPTLGHLTEAGLLTENEEKIIDALDEKCIQHPKYWISLVWAGAILTRAKKEGRIKDDYAFNSMLQEIAKFRVGCGGLFDYNWISVPLVYTQVVTLAVYMFSLSSLMGRQFLNPKKNLPGYDVDLIVPIFTFLQFFFYMGWLKVAEVFINPFGEDDDDFEMNWLIDRNIQVAYLIVDDMHADYPELIKDQYWDEVVPDELPYTVASEQFRTDPFLGSTVDVEVPIEDQEIIFLDRIDEDENQDKNDLENSIGHNPNSIPVGRNRSRNSNRTSVGTHQGSILSTTQAGSNIGSHRSSFMPGSMLGAISKMFSSSNMNSKIGSMQNKRRKRSRIRRVSTRTFSRASNMTSDTGTRDHSPPDFHRIPTKSSQISNDGGSNIGVDNEVFSLSNSSINSFHSESVVDEENDFQRRSNSDMKQLKKKLEKVQGLQHEIMKDLEAEISYEKEAQNFSKTSSDVMSVLEEKTLELRMAVDEKRKQRERFDSMTSSPTEQFTNSRTTPFKPVQPSVLAVQHSVLAVQPSVLAVQPGVQSSFYSQADRLKTAGNTRIGSRNSTAPASPFLNLGSTPPNLYPGISISAHPIQCSSPTNHQGAVHVPGHHPAGQVSGVSLHPVAMASSQNDFFNQESMDQGYLEGSDTESLLPKLSRKSLAQEENQNNGEESLFSNLATVPENKPL